MTNIDTVRVGPFEVNCFVLHQSGGAAIVVDPGAESSKIEALLLKRGLHVSAYMLTHGHMDHICALKGLWQSAPAPIYMHASDLEWAFTESNQMPPHYPVPERPKTDIETFSDSEEPLADWGCQIIHTPGHTPGSCCLHFPAENILISGDTLFRGSVGRTDFPGGDARTLTHSLKKLRDLPVETVVYPGHGPSTTIGYEIDNNIFMRRV